MGNRERGSLSLLVQHGGPKCNLKVAQCFGLQLVLDFVTFMGQFLNIEQVDWSL